MKKEWWGADVVPRIKWRIELPDWKRYVSSHRHMLPEGEEIPDGYGIAYYEDGRPVAVLYPIPINLIVGAWRAFMWRVRCPPWRMAEWKANLPVRLAKQEGYREGFDRANGFLEVERRIAFDRGYTQGHRDVLANFDKILAELTAPRTIFVEKGAFDGIKPS